MSNPTKGHSVCVLQHPFVQQSSSSTLVTFFFLLLQLVPKIKFCRGYICGSRRPAWYTQKKCTEQRGCASILKKKKLSNCIKVVSYAKNRIWFYYGMMRTELSHLRTGVKEWTKRNPKKSAYSIWCRFVIPKLHGVGFTFRLSLLKGGRTRHIFLFQNVPDRPWGPPSLLFSRYRCFSHGRGGG